MSSPDLTPYQNWWKNTVGAAVPWLAGGPNGQAEGGAWPAVFDYFIAQLVQARYQRFPDKCSPDALPHIGNDMWLVQGTNESTASFITRCKDPWGQWSRAGTACSVLEQLWYFGLTNAYWVQQNGKWFTFNGQTLTPGQDPTSLLQYGNTATLAATLTSTVQSVFAPPGVFVPPGIYSAIPAGNPFFCFDGNTDLCNRFAIIVPSWPFAALAQATFVNSDAATVTWPFQFGSTSYKVLYGVPSAPVQLSNDATAQTTNGTTIRASGPWSGSVWVIGFASGVNPFNIYDTTSAGVLQRLITTFRSNAICTSVTAIQSGRVWDWSPTVAWDDGGTWATNNGVATILGSF